jgi:hypothetical protein
LSLWPWQETVKAVFLDRVNILSEYDRVVHSPSFSMKLPSVIALKEFVPQERRPAFTRFNVFLRDRFRCQYCGDNMPAPDLTFDHVIPRSRGGRTNWENVVIACPIRPACCRGEHRSSPVPSSCRRMAAPSRQTTFTKVGGIFFTGIPSWKPAERAAPAKFRISGKSHISGSVGDFRPRLACISAGNSPL